MEETYGSTCTISPFNDKIVFKKPLNYDDTCLQDDVVKGFLVEHQILERLGRHPRIVDYLGRHEDGILLAKATHGDLESFLSANHATTPPAQRMTWCRQLTEAISFIHSRGVIHSDLRPRNILVNRGEQGGYDLALCDFGGSTCPELGLDGGTLPDGPFYNPALGNESDVSLDLFSLGSLFYTILEGHWPYRSSTTPFTVQEKLEYEELVRFMITEGRFPEVDKLYAGNVIMGCWKMEYQSADEVLRALDECTRRQKRGSRISAGSLSGLASSFISRVAMILGTTLYPALKRLLSGMAKFLSF